MKKKTRRIIKYDNIIVPVEIHKENRLDIRVSIVKEKATIKIPFFHTNNKIEKDFQWAKDWIIKNIEQNPSIKNRFIIKEYNTGDKLIINDSTFSLNLIKSNNINYFVKLNEDIIEIKIPIEHDLLEKQKAIKTLQSRIIAKYFINEISDRINSINKNHFKVDINLIKLKYNKSNWGSRSSKNNINISTRLLFAPKDVQDYVFIHELAHFFEMNHSPKFWNIVKSIMPDYKEKEKWLKVEGPKHDF